MSRWHQMMGLPLRHAASIVACCAVALALAGCGAGQVTQTDSQVPLIDGSNADVGDIAIRDALIPYPKHEHGQYPSGSTVPVQLTLVNQGTTADTLVRASTPAASRVLVQGTTTIPPGMSVATAREFEQETASTDPTATEPTTTLPVEPVSPLDIGELRFLLVNTTGTLQPGENIELTLVFRNAGTVTMPVPMGPPPAGTEREPLEEGSGH